VFALVPVTRCDEPKGASARWPRFRGPGGLGVAPEQTKLPAEFGAAKNFLWKTPLPPGHSSPCVWDDRIFVTAFDKEAKQLETICLDRGKGTIRWRRAAAAKQIEAVHEVNTPASPTPAADADGVYVYFGSCGLLAYDHDGNEKWKYTMPVAGIRFGSGASPVVAGDLVLLNVPEAGKLILLAVNRTNGTKVWQRQQPVGFFGFPLVWSTPLIWRQDGADLAVISSGGRLAAYALPQGTDQWHVDGLPSMAQSSPTVGDGLLFFAVTNPVGDPQNLIKIPTFDEALKLFDKNKDGKIVKDEIPADYALVDRGRTDKKGNFLFLHEDFARYDRDKDGALGRKEWEAMARSRGFFEAMAKISAGAVRLGGKGNVTKTHVAWRADQGVPDVPSPLYYQGRVYFVTERGILTCRDARTGKEVYKKRLQVRGTCYASPVVGSGRIYQASDGGTIIVFQPGDNFEVVAANELDEAIFATPALVGGKIYVRTMKHLWAFGQ
jgi:outer membrane protein assembly factor BamB